MAVNDARLRHAARVRRRGGRLRPIERRRTACCVHMRGARDGRAVDAHVPRGSHVLDLGCGPGTDAEKLADARLPRDGDRLVAGDGRRGAPARVLAAGCWRSRRRPPPRHPRARPTAAGCVRCRVLELRPAQLRAPISPAPRGSSPTGCGRGGVLVASVIGRVCPWEMALLSPRAADWPRAARPLRRGRCPCRSNGRTVWTRYYTPAELRADRSRAAGFSARLAAHARPVRRRRRTCEAFAGRHPRSSRALQRVEDRRRRMAGAAQRLGRSLSDRASRKARRAIRRPWLPRFACPECRTPLGQREHRRWRRALCAACGATFERARTASGASLDARRAAAADPFVAAVSRRPPARRTPLADARVLPQAADPSPPDDPHAGDWRIRRESYHAPAAARAADGLAGRSTCSTSAPAAAGCRTGWPRSAIAPSPSIASTTRRTAWARAVTTRWRFRPCRPTSTRCRSRRRSSISSSSTGRCTTRPTPRRRCASATRMLAPGGALAVMDSPMFCARRATGEAMVADSNVRRLRDRARPHRASCARRRVPHVRAAERALPSASASGRAFFPSRGPLGLADRAVRSRA